MNDRAFFNWLIVFLGVIAIMGFGFTPAFAEEMMDPTRAQVTSEDDSTLVTPLEDPELSDESFGRNYQYTWIPSSNFQPASSSCTFTRTGGYLYRTGGSDMYFFAGINLPSGAYLGAAQVFYYDNHGGTVNGHVYSYTYPNTLDTLDSCISSGTPGYSYCTMYPYETIRNGDRIYTAYVGLSQSTSSLRFMGMRLYWRRQIRTGLSHPFNDIGGLSSEFQASIAALYQSGITTGTSSTTFSPYNAVTRGQFATFFARALGLHWAYPY